MKEKNLIKEKAIKILLFLNTISAIYIPCLGHYIDNITIYYFLINIISFIFIIMLRPKIRIKGFFKFVLLYFLILIISTILNNGAIYLLLFEAGTTLLTFLLWNSFNKKEFNDYIGVLTLVLEILTYINLASIIIFPNGLYNINSIRKYYIFDHVNVSIRYLLPGSCLLLINKYKNNFSNKRCYIYIASVIITLLLTKPMTAVIGYTIFILSLIIFKKLKYITNFFKPIYSHIATGIISYLIIFFSFQKRFLNLIGNLERDLTFTGRTIIWDRTINFISQKPLLGYGRMTQTVRESYLKVSSAHNQFLNFLFEGGIILLAHIFIIIYIISLKLVKCNNENIKRIIFATLLSYSIMWITEPFSYSGTSLMFMIWLIAYNSPILFNETEVKK